MRRIANPGRGAPFNPDKDFNPEKELELLSQDLVTDEPDLEPSHAITEHKPTRAPYLQILKRDLQSLQRLYPQSRIVQSSIYTLNQLIRIECNQTPKPPGAHPHKISLPTKDLELLLWEAEIN